MSGGRVDRRPYIILLLPAIVFLVLFFLLPLQTVLVLGFFDAQQYQLYFDVSFHNYVTVLTEWAYVKPLIRSVFMAGAVSAACMAIGWPVAYWISKRKYRLVLILLTAVPFVTGIILRVTALQLLFSPAGLVDQAAARLGVSVTPGMMYSDFGTFVGLIYIWLPFVILAIYLSLQNFDERLEEAAAAAGAGFLRRFWYVVLPENRVGSFIGFAFVFIPALGASTESQFLGGPNGMLYGNLIQNQIDAGTWTRGAAMAFVLLGVSVSVLWWCLISIRRDLTSLTGHGWNN